MSILKNRENKISDILFFVAFGIFLVSEILLTSFYAQYISTLQLRVIRYIWLILLVIREFFVSKEYNIVTLMRLLFHNVKWLIALIVIIFFTIVLKFTTSNNLVFFVMIFALCARNLDFNFIAKVSFGIILGTVVFVIISSYIGVIENYIYISATRRREYLGFLISLYPSMYLFSLSALYLCFRKNQITLIELAVMVLINIWMFLQTRSRLAFILSILIICVFTLLKFKPMFFKGKTVLCSFIVLSFAICFVGCLALVFIYSDSSSLMEQLDTILGHRLSLSQKSISNNGIHLFGQQLFMIGNGLIAATGQMASGEYSYVDSYYLQFMIRNGIIYTIIWLVLLTATMYLIYRSENFQLLICMVFIAIGMTIDDELGRLCFNPFLLLIYSSILQRFMSQHGEKPKLFPGDEGKIIHGLNRLFSWHTLPQTSKTEIYKKMEKKGENER